jgi:hypothetical protein
VIEHEYPYTFKLACRLCHNAAIGTIAIVYAAQASVVAAIPEDAETTDSASALECLKMIESIPALDKVAHECFDEALIFGTIQVVKLLYRPPGHSAHGFFMFVRHTTSAV